MVVLETCVIGVDADQVWCRGEGNAAFFDEFLAQGVNGGLAAFNAAAGQEPAFCVGVADHEDVAVSVFDRRADTERHWAAEAKPALEGAGAEVWHVALCPSWLGLAIRSRQIHSFGLIERLNRPFGIKVMYALYAILITFAVFGILNLIDFKRID